MNREDVLSLVDDIMTTCSDGNDIDVARGMVEEKFDSEIDKLKKKLDQQKIRYEEALKELHDVRRRDDEWRWECERRILETLGEDEFPGNYEDHVNHLMSKYKEKFYYKGVDCSPARFAIEFVREFIDATCDKGPKRQTETYPFLRFVEWIHRNHDVKPGNMTFPQIT